MRVAVALAGCLVLFAFAPDAVAAPATLHVGSHGKRVAGLQWLLGGHVPSHFRSIRTFPRKPNGLYGKRTADAVAAAKWRMGYPAHAVNRSAGPLLFDLLLGRKKRPIAWIQTAAYRQRRLVQIQADVKLSACQRRVIEIGRSQLGQHEQPFGSNWGGMVPAYLAAAGIHYPAPWCAAWTQWVMVNAGYGRYANASAGVFYIEGWAHQHGLLRATPHPGVLVLFLTSQGHMGIVERVRQDGVVSLEGNASNQVERRFHAYSRSMVFVYLPGCSAAARLYNPNGSVFASVFSAPAGTWVLLGVLSLVALFAPQPHVVLRRRRARSND